MKQTYSRILRTPQEVNTDTGNILTSKDSSKVVLCTGSGNVVIIGGAGAIIGMVIKDIDITHYLPFHGSVTLHTN